MNRQEIIESAKNLGVFLLGLSEEITSKHPELETTVDVSRHFVRNEEHDDYIYVTFIVSTDGCETNIFYRHIGLSKYTKKQEVDEFFDKVKEMYNNIK